MIDMNNGGDMNNERKSDAIQILLSLFFLPFALLYSRGILGWIKSIVWVFAALLFQTLVALIMQLDDQAEMIGMIITVCAIGLVYFVFSMTDASRVNKAGKL